MERNRIFTAMTLAAALALAACTQDEIADSTTLPDGLYPLEIASATLEVESSEQPWTRVSESNDRNSSNFDWNGTEQIGVQLGSETATYTLNSGNTLTADNPIYWKNTNSATITAWYPTDATIDLTDQSEGLAYVLKGTGTGSYKSPVSLSFTHALAKVRVALTGSDADKVTDVKIKSCTTCTNDKSTISGADEGWITMQQVNATTYEANVVPGYTITDFQVNGASGKLNDNGITPLAAKVNTITLTVELPLQEVDITSISGSEYTVSGNVHLKGDGKAKDLILKVAAGSKLKLENVVLNAPATQTNTIEVQGTATLVLSGQNEITGHSQECPLAVMSGTLTIDGTDSDQLKLTGGNSTDAGCLGLNSGTNLIINGGHIVADGSQTEGAGIGSYWNWIDGRKCGSITINGGRVEAYGGRGSAGIGAGNECTCGDIIITGGNITAKGGGGWGGAGVGSSSSGSCGNITISGQNTVVVATAGSDSSDDIGIGDGGTCGTVTITDGAKVTATNGRIHGQ